MSYIDTYDVLKSEKTKVFCKQRDVVVLHHGVRFPECHQRQYRRQGTKLDRYWGITKHRKERYLRGRMLLVTLQHDLTSTLDSGVQTDMLVLVFSKAFDRVPNIQFTREATPRWHQGIPNSRSHTSFLAEPSVAVDLRVVLQKACLS